MTRGIVLLACRGGHRSAHLGHSRCRHKHHNSDHSLYADNWFHAVFCACGPAEIFPRRTNRATMDPIGAVMNLRNLLEGHPTTEFFTDLGVLLVRPRLPGVSRQEPFRALPLVLKLERANRAM